MPPLLWWMLVPQVNTALPDKQGSTRPGTPECARKGRAHRLPLRSVAAPPYAACEASPRRGQPVLALLLPRHPERGPLSPARPQRRAGGLLCLCL